MFVSSAQKYRVHLCPFLCPMLSLFKSSQITYKVRWWHMDYWTTHSRFRNLIELKQEMQQLKEANNLNQIQVDVLLDMLTENQAVQATKRIIFEWIRLVYLTIA